MIADLLMQEPISLGVLAEEGSSLPGETEELGLPNETGLPEIPEEETEDSAPLQDTQPPVLEVVFLKQNQVQVPGTVEIQAEASNDSNIVFLEALFENMEQVLLRTELVQNREKNCYEGQLRVPAETPEGVYVDGIYFPVQKDPAGGPDYVDLPVSGYKSLVTYSYHMGNEDSHTQYPNEVSTD